MRGFLVSTQITLSVVVLAVAGLSLRQFVDVRRTDPGYRADGVLLVTFDPGAVGYSQGQVRQFYDRMLEGTRTVAGVTGVGLTEDIPLVFGFRSTSLTVDGFDMPEDRQTLSIRSLVVDPGYWTVMRTSIVGGRSFNERDTGTSPLVVVVNETMARRYWPRREALGGTVHLGGRGGRQAEVIGIARDGKYDNIAERSQPFLYLPFSQKVSAQPDLSVAAGTSASAAMTMVVLVTGNVASVAGPIRAEAAALDTSMPVFNIRSLQEAYEMVAIGQQSLVSQMLTFIALLAMVLTVVGLYAVVSYVTALRTREIGIRIALGAGRPDILMMVLRQAIPMVGLGLVVGIGLAYVLTPAFAFAFNFAPRDLTVLVAVPLVLTATAAAASLIPARRAAKLSPALALRE